MSKFIIAPMLMLLAGVSGVFQGEFEIYIAASLIVLALPDSREE